MLMNVSNSRRNWARENLPAFQEFAAAVQQLTLAAGHAGSPAKIGSYASANAVRVARERLTTAVALVRSCPLPPDEATARCLKAALTAYEDFTDSA
jgi:hypothetical protein